MTNNPRMQSPPFGILGINNNNPHHTGNPLQRQQQQTQELDNSLLSWSRTLLLGLANAEEKEEKESESKQAPGAPRKEHPTWETELTLLLTLTRASQPDPQLTLMMTAFLWTLLELHVVKQKARERKRRLQKLLL